jgi:hypothetical protein
MRRAFMPSGTAEHGAMATPSASSTARMNGAQQGSSKEGCSCAAKGPDSTDGEDGGDDEDAFGTDPFGTDNEHTGMTGTTNSRMHASSSMATPSSSAPARHANMATTPAASSHAAKPSGADAFSPFQGAGVQMVPSMSIVVGGVLAGVVGVFAAL